MRATVAGIAEVETKEVEMEVEVAAPSEAVAEGHRVTGSSPLAALGRHVAPPHVPLVRQHEAAKSPRE